MPAHEVNYIRWAACPSIFSKTLWDLEVEYFVHLNLYKTVLEKL